MNAPRLTARRGNDAEFFGFANPRLLERGCL
jgi:hypothetical protein